MSLSVSLLLDEVPSPRVGDVQLSPRGQHAVPDADGVSHVINKLKFKCPECNSSLSLRVLTPIPIPTPIVPSAKPADVQIHQEHDAARESRPEASRAEEMPEGNPGDCCYGQNRLRKCLLVAMGVIFVSPAIVLPLALLIRSLTE